MLHLSLHTDIDATAQASGEIDETTLEDLPAEWTIATRSLGEGSIRATKTGAWDERPAAEPHLEPSNDSAVVPASPRWWRLLKPRTR
ncbi:hypothetical protein [Nocardia sp. NPDC059691]|uniref:hypothetical protein n=1 Tax=Nocardia sp. NPDC059691 TaxID=3346908 RepID=UPI0036C82CBE